MNNQQQSQKDSSNTLTLTATKASLIDSGTKSLVDFDSLLSKDIYKCVTLPTLEVLPTSFKNKVGSTSHSNNHNSYNNKQRSVIEKFDNQLQSYFQTAKSSNGFSSLGQTRAPPSPEKSERNILSINYLTPQQLSKYPISFNSLTEFPPSLKRQKDHEFSQEHTSSKKDKERQSNSLNSQNVRKGQNIRKGKDVFNIQKQHLKYHQLIDFDVLKQKEKIVQLVNKDRKVRISNTAMGKNRQVSQDHNIVEKVRREEKNFFVTVSIMDSKAQKLLKNVKYTPNSQALRKIRLREKKDFFSTGMGGNINSTQQQERVNQLEIEVHSQSVDDIFSNIQSQQDTRSIRQQQLLNTPPSSPKKEEIPLIQQILQSKDDEESPHQNQNKFEDINKYDSLLTPILELDSQKQSNITRNLDGPYPNDNISISNNWLDNKEEHKNEEYQQSKTSVFQTNNNEIMRVTITTPQLRDQSIEISSPSENIKPEDETITSKDINLSQKEHDDDIYDNNDDNDDRNGLNAKSYRKKSNKDYNNEKNISFGFLQDNQKVDSTPTSKHVQSKGILKKGPSKMLSQEGTDQSESDLTTTNKKTRISFAQIKKQNTINQQPTKSYFKSFSQAIVDDQDDSNNQDYDIDETYKTRIKKKLGIPQPNQINKNNNEIQSSNNNNNNNNSNNASLEYADDEFKDYSQNYDSSQSGNTSFNKEKKNNFGGLRKTQASFKSEKSLVEHSPIARRSKSKSQQGKYKSSQLIDEYDNEERDKKAIQIKTLGSQDRISIKQFRKDERKNNESKKSKSRIQDSQEEEDSDLEIEGNNHDTSQSSFAIKSQEGAAEGVGARIRKKKSRKYSVQVNDLAEFQEMETNHTLSLGSIAKLFLKLHKAKKNALLTMKNQPEQPIQLNQFDLSSDSGSDLSFLQQSKKEESQSNFNDYCDDFDNDSQTFTSFVIPSLGEHLGETDSRLGSGSHQGDGTSKNINKKHILQKIVSKKSFNQPSSKYNQRIQSLKSKIFDKTPSNNFELRNVRKTEVQLLKQKIENLQKEFRISGLNLGQKKKKINKLIQEILKKNAKEQSQEVKQTDNLIQAIQSDLNFEKQNDEAYFEEIMSNAPIINDELIYFSKLRMNKINDPKYLMKFEEQPMMNRDRDFLTELKKDNIYIDDQMLETLHKHNMINEDEMQAIERRNLFEQQTKLLQKIGLASNSKNAHLEEQTPFPHSIFQTELEYEGVLEEMGLKQKEKRKRNTKNMRSQKYGDFSPEKVLEKKIDKYLELSKIIQNLPITKLKQMKAKLSEIQSKAKILSTPNLSLFD